MGFRPLHDRVVVRRLEPENRTAGGIIILNSVQIDGEDLVILQESDIMGVIC